MSKAQFPHLDEAINAESYEWLEYNAPDLATAVQRELATGATPQQIHMHIMKTTQRAALALRCEQAAKHLAAVGDG